MKVITFFNEKGGSAKSTFATIFASWLQYEHGVNTAVVDIDNRIARDRKMQELVCQEKNERQLWDIYDVNKNYLESINKKYHLHLKRYADWFNTYLKTGKFDKYDVIIIDFPGNMDDFIQFYHEDLLSLVVIPVERDTHTMTTTIRLSKGLAYKDIPRIGFINKIQAFQSNRLYEQMMSVQQSFGLKMLPDMISFSERVSKTMDKETPPDTIIRSTLDYPNWQSETFKGGGDLGIENLLVDISKELKKCKDITGTRPVNLDFVNTLEKKFHPKRQLRGSSFPEYEFDESFFSESKK